MMVWIYILIHSTNKDLVSEALVSWTSFYLLLFLLLHLFVNKLFEDLVNGNFRLIEGKINKQPRRRNSHLSDLTELKELIFSAILELLPD